MRLALALLALLLSSAVMAEPVIGRASVVDGDTLEIAGQRIRLLSIDAPESAQYCQLPDRTWRCGQQAALWLDAWIDGRTVTCKAKGRDRYGRVLAHCTVAGQSMNAALVRAGWAWAYLKYSREYAEEEARARRDGVGVWVLGNRAEAPWDWRRARR